MTRGFDMEMQEVLARILKGRGIRQHPEINPTKVRLLPSLTLEILLDD